MNASIVALDPRAGNHPWTMPHSVQAAAGTADETHRAKNSVAGPVRLLSESRARAMQRTAEALADPLLQRIRDFAHAVNHGEEVIAFGASPLVRQEAARLAVLVAEIGLSVTSHADAVAMPSVHQTPSGSIQFEWHRKGVDLEIEVLMSGQMIAYLERSGHEPKELSVAGEFALIEPELRAVLHR